MNRHAQPRRTLLGGLPALAVVSHQPPAALPHPDAALLAACAEQRAACDRLAAAGATCRASPNCMEADAAYEAAWDAMQEAGMRAVALPATTREGLAAKIRAVRIVWEEYREDCPEDRDDDERAIDLLLPDLLALLPLPAGMGWEHAA